MSGNTVEHAILYARRGWPVLPLHSIRAGVCTCGNTGCRSAGKHPRTKHGYKNATTDETLIREWWSKNPDSNIGIVTGKKSGLLVVDIDPRNGGDTTFSELCIEHGAPTTLSVKTGGGGTHLIFRYPENVDGVKGRSNALGDGVDIKADGGYIVAAPSVHASGNCYQWVDPECEISPTPEWIQDRLIDSGSKQYEGHAVVTEGGRNNYLASTAGKLKHQGVSNGELYRLLQEENILQCKPPLSENEVEQIARSISAYDGRPRKFRWIDHISDPDTPITGMTHHVLMTLSKWMDAEGRNCFPKIEQIADACRHTRKTVGDHLKRAEDAGLIKRYKVFPKDKGGGRNWNYGYVALLPHDE